MCVRACLSRRMPQGPHALMRSCVSGPLAGALSAPAAAGCGGSLVARLLIAGVSPLSLALAAGTIATSDAGE